VSVVGGWLLVGMSVPLDAFSRCPLSRSLFPGAETSGQPNGLRGALQSAKNVVHRGWSTSVELLDELINHRFFQSFQTVDWSDYQLGPILVASVLINLLELASPIYINIVYTSVLPSGALSSLVVLTVAVVVLMVLGGWLKTVRLSLTGADGARLEHRRRMEALIHFSNIRLEDYLREPPATHAERLNSINMLRDESSLQALTTAIDLAFSLLFVLVLFLIAGSTGLVAVVAIVVYVLRALAFARQYESLSKQRDLLELDRLTYQGKLMASIDLIKANGLGRKYLVGHEKRQEELAWQRMVNARFSGQQQSFGTLMSQLTLAGIVTWGGLLVINGRLMVGALAAALLLSGKILAPWQQAMALWSSYRRLGHARDEYDTLMALSTEAEGGQAEIQLSADSAITLALNAEPLAILPSGSVSLLRDGSFGSDTRHLFLALLQIEPEPSLRVNGLAMASYRRDHLRQVMAYVDPSHDFFDGTILQNITSFQPRCYQRRALFWAFLSGLDTRVRALPNGYQTTLGTTVPSGLSRDAQSLLQVITALARSPQLLLLDLSDCSYGKEFIDGLQRMLRRTRGNTTVLISGTGRVLSALADQEFTIPLRRREVLR
jgi:ATP-binding cassette subfamily C protein LapB